MYFVVYIYYNMDILQKTQDFFTKSRELMVFTEKKLFIIRILTRRK